MPRYSRDLDRRIAAAEAAIAETRARAAELLTDAQEKLALAEARAAQAPEAFRRSYAAEIRVRRYLCEQFAALAA